MNLKKTFFKQMDNCAFGKTMESLRNHRDIKLVITDKKRNQLVSQPNYWTIKDFSENCNGVVLEIYLHRKFQ